MRSLDLASRQLVRLAAAIAVGEGPGLERVAREALEAGVPVAWGDELVLQSVLMLGYPRALAAAAVWRGATGQPPASEENGADFERVDLWRSRGEATCKTVYGANYRKLRANVAALHPALDAWMVVEGYGRTLSRPGLDLVRRELAVIAQVLVLGAERQLHSHLRGALNAGAESSAVEQTLAIAGEFAPAAHVAMAAGLWERIR